jgi:threonine dehydrogenase-like Zn-dependent dehydrogenase
MQRNPMKAVAVVAGTRESLHVRDDAPEPRPEPGEALVRVLEAGVCGTDVEIHQGLYGAAPPGSPCLSLGHENLGVIESAPAESGLAAGDVVVSTVGAPALSRRACVSDQNDRPTGHSSRGTALARLCLSGTRRTPLPDRSAAALRPSAC